MFSKLKAVFSRATPEDTAADKLSRRSLLCLGGKSAPLLLTQLEALAAAVRKSPEAVRGIIIGAPLDRVERVLASAGFDTAENLYSLTTPRRILRFEDPLSHTLWHMNESELRRNPGAEKPVPGKSYPVAANWNFNEWAPEGKGLMRNRHTDRRLARPTSLMFLTEIAHLPNDTYEAFTAALPHEEIVDRLNYYRNPGSKAMRHIRNIITLAEITAAPLDLVRLTRLTLDESELHRLVELASASLDSLDESERRQAEDIIEELMACDEKAPIGAVELARDLDAKLINKRTQHPLAEFLTPGKIWHVAANSQEEKFIAYCLKRDLLRHLLTTPDSEDTTLVFVNEWPDHLDPELDIAAMEHPGIMLCYTLRTCEKLWEKPSQKLPALLHAFPRQAWHTMNEGAAIPLLRASHPNFSHAADHLAKLDWDVRFEAVSDKVSRVPLNAGIDGQEALERSVRGATATSANRNAAPTPAGR